MELRKLALGGCVALAVTGCFFDFADPTVDPATVTLNDLAVHDPSVIRDSDGTFYVFGSHLAAARSTDLMNWQYIANGVDATNPLWSTIPLAGNQWTGIPGSWAADVIKLKNGKYHFYYSFCGDSARPAMQRAARVPGRRGFGSHRRSLRGPGYFPALGHDAAEIAAGYGPEGVTSYDARVHPNTIDPDVFYDQARQAVDGVRLLFGRHFHPANGRDHRQAAARTGLRQAPRGRRSQRHRRAVTCSTAPESATTTCSCRSAASLPNDGYNIRIARSRNPGRPLSRRRGTRPGRGPR